MQTILGAGGPIANALAKNLTNYTDRIRLVSRNPKAVNPNDELYSADLTDPTAIERALIGSKIVYVTVGFEYSAAYWEQHWPVLMQAVIDACIKNNIKLVFFDNVYAYAPNAIKHMTEQSIEAPSSRKGRVRSMLREMIMSQVNEGHLTATIARSADFYGPANDKSVLVSSVVQKLKAGKPAEWFCNANKLHNFTYTPDAGKYTALLGNTPDAYNKIWHLPTVRATMTAKEWVEKIATMIGVPAKIQMLPYWAFTPLSWFIPILKEFKEMAYQFQDDYDFDSSAFEMYFEVKPTPIEEALKATIAGN